LIDPTVFEKHQVGWGKEKKGNGQWFGARRKQTRRKADKDNRALQSQGRPSNFLVFFLSLPQARLALFFALYRPLPTDTLCGQSQTPTVTFFLFSIPLSSSFNLKKLKDAAAR
jgi:hypothetical protein